MKTGRADALVVNADTAVGIAALLERAAGAARVRIHVPEFTDGRVFSQVRALLESAAFTGTIEVHGDLLPDQVTLLERYGVRNVVLENGMNADDRPRFLTGAYRERRLRSGAGAQPTHRNEEAKQ